MAWRADDASFTPRPAPFFVGMDFGEAVESVRRAVGEANPGAE